MRVLIVEDEKLAADRLERMLRDLAPQAKLAGRCASVSQTVDWLQNHQADLIFLDIQLSDGVSFSVFEQVKVKTPVIFTTAYDEYAIKAFKINSIAYLLKPIRKKDLAESLEKYHELKSAYGIDYESLLAELQGGKTRYRERFLIQVGEKIRKIETRDVAYFFALEKEVYLRRADGKTYDLDTSLDKLEPQLAPEQFFRINRKYIVQMDAISEMYAWSRSRVKLTLSPPADDEMDTIVSTERSPAFKKWIGS